MQQPRCIVILKLAGIRQCRCYYRIYIRSVSLENKRKILQWIQEYKNLKYIKFHNAEVTEMHMLFATTKKVNRCSNTFFQKYEKYTKFGNVFIDCHAAVNKTSFALVKTKETNSGWQLYRSLRISEIPPSLEHVCKFCAHEKEEKTHCIQHLIE